MFPGLVSFLASYLVLGDTFVVSATSSPACKAVPGSPHWPSVSTWQTFNTSLGGVLLAPLPPAIVCDPSRPSTFSSSQCGDVSKLWFNSSLHSSDPVSIDWPNWQNDGCLPPDLDPRYTSPCDLQPFPRYVVNASSAEHVAATVKFASRNSVRLSVKGTGHDLLGRSTSPGLSLWTHHIQGPLNINASFKPIGCPKCKSSSAITVSAGHRWHDVYTVVAAANRVVVGGGDSDVGMGGYLTGGGHGPISATFGLASDNILEMTVVTPSGDIVVANEFQHSDLFWAMRGGGGATFGVLITATLKTFKRPAEINSFIMQFNSTEAQATQQNNSAFFETVAYLHSQLPELAEEGIMGYYFMFPVQVLAGSELSLSAYTALNISNLTGPLQQSFTFIGWGFNRTLANVEAAFANVAKTISDTAGLTSVFYAFPPTELNLFDTVTNSQNSVGINLRMGSRLFDEPSLKNTAGFTKMLRTFESSGMEGVFVCGPGTLGVPPNSSAVNPAWRRAYLHIVLPVPLPYHASSAINTQIATYLTHNLTQAFRDQAPDMGCYVNESDVNEPDWQHAFWGAHYERLVQIKKELDPKMVFWCGNCVGNEGWKAQASGELCPV